MTKVSSLVIVILALAFGCKKDESAACNNIEKPGSYFPGFPNTWWKYVNNDGDTIVYEVSSNYETCHGKCRPVFLNIDKCISDMGFVHDFYAGQGTQATVISPIYSLTLDSVLTCPISFVTFQIQSEFIGQEDVRFKRVTTNLDTSIVISGVDYPDVIQVYEYDKFNPDHRYFDYFANDIGLIKRDSLDANDPAEHIQILKIEDYFIGN